MGKIELVLKWPLNLITFFDIIENLIFGQTGVDAEQYEDLWQVADLFFFIGPNWDFTVSNLSTLTFGAGESVMRQINTYVKAFASLF